VRQRARTASALAGLTLFVAALGAAGAAWAIQPDEIMANPKQEARARAIGRDLRCLVCQNESIDDSDADLAHDLRLLVRQRISAGDSDAQVKQYIVARYGNYVLLKPPFIPETYLLWLGPFLLLAAGGVIAAVYYRRTAQTAPVEPLSADQDRRLVALIGEGEAETGDKDA
jgi:cytochrome c-type biogenesis protein CcmH